LVVLAMDFSICSPQKKTNSRGWGGANSHEYMRRGGFPWKVELILLIRYPWKNLDGNLVSNCVKILIWIVDVHDLQD
jgi:hypothetical protein